MPDSSQAPPAEEPQQSSPIRVAIHAALGVCLTGWLGCASNLYAQQSTKDVVQIKPTGTTNESQFMVYVYQKLQYQLPATIQQTDQVRKQLTQLRDRVNLYNEYAKRKEIDTKVQSLYANLLTAIDLTSDYVIQLDRIDRSILAQRQQQLAETGTVAGSAGGYVGVTAYRDGATGGDAALAGITVAAITYLLDDFKKRQVLDETKQRALEDASESFARKMSAVQAREKDGLSAVAEAYGWERLDNGVLENPFVKLESDLAEQYSKASTAAETLAACNLILEAARVVPAASVFDEERAYALYWVASGATWAARKELEGKRWGAAPAPSADLAVKLWNTALRYAPTDPDGEFRAERACALGMGGHFSEAKTQANAVFSLRRGNPGFLYQYVSLWSSSGTPDMMSLTNLKACLRWIDLQTVKTDPNLGPLRQAYPAEFADLMKIKWDWDINWGWGLANDEICLANKSAFPLTNVKLDVTVKSTGYANWGPRRFEAILISPGQVFRWKVDIPTQGNDAQGSASLIADQDN